MNTPNKLTVLRILMIPFFILFLLWDSLPGNSLYALLLFVAASITDALDGYLARKYHLITDFGKFLDPLADKLLVTSAFICFIEMGLASSVAVVIIIAREFLVTSLRLVSSGSGVVIAANIFGKIKTISQMIVIIVILLLECLKPRIQFPFDFPTLSNGLIWIIAVITVLSGGTYLWENRHCIREIT